MVGKRMMVTQNFKNKEASLENVLAMNIVHDDNVIVQRYQ